jgi:integrase
MARKLPRFLTLEEVRHMITASKKNKRDQIVIRCLFYLGMRN